MVSWNRCPALARIVAVVLTAVALAGCVGGDEALDPPEPDTTGEPRMDATTGERRLPLTDRAPAWRVGDYWVYTGSDGTTNTFVVTGETATDYTIDTDGDTYAFFNAIEDISTLGPQRKSDLAGSQDSTRVEFFRFPLKDGDTWTTTWDDETRRIVATDMGGGVFGFESNAENGTPHARYTYDAEARWFGALEFLGEGGEVLFGNTLVEAGRGFTGAVVRYEVDRVFAHSEEGSEPPIDARLRTSPFTQDESHTDVFLIYNADCTTGYLQFTVVPEDPAADTPGYTATDPCPKGEAFFGSLGSQPGEWAITLVQATDTDAGLSAEVYLRTATTLAVEPAAAP